MFISIINKFVNFCEIIYGIFLISILIKYIGFKFIIFLWVFDRIEFWKLSKYYLLKFFFFYNYKEFEINL